MKKADIEARRQRLAELALREFRARCLHCKAPLTPASAPWLPFCSDGCKTAATEVAAMKASRT